MSEELDTQMENEISDLGLNAPRITKEHIDELMEKVTYETFRVGDSTLTMSVASLDGFKLAVGESACVDPSNFNAEFGAKYAKLDAEEKARDALWGFEGYMLKFK